MNCKVSERQRFLHLHHLTWVQQHTTKNHRQDRVQLYRYFVSQSSEFCRHNPLKGTATSNTKGKRIFRYRLSPETFGYTLVKPSTTTFGVIYFLLRAFFIKYVRSLCFVRRYPGRLRHAESRPESRSALRAGFQHCCLETGVTNKPSLTSQCDRQFRNVFKLIDMNKKAWVQVPALLFYCSVLGLQ
jgi:hypothetical protein